MVDSLKNPVDGNPKNCYRSAFLCVVVLPAMVKYARSKVFWLILGGVCAHISCHSVGKPPSTGSVNGLSTEIKQNMNSVTVEIFNVPIAPNQNELLQQLWREIDEQSLPPQLRRELYAQGFRVGILGSLLSPALAQLLKVSTDAKADAAWGEWQEVSAADAAQESMITRNSLILLPGMRSVVKIFDEHARLPEFPLFWEEDGMMSGQTYRGALGLICVSATAHRDGAAQIQIVPELEHGLLEQRFRMQAAIIVPETGRPRHTFESLTVSQRLLPGQWLIMGTTTLDSAGAGKAFFSRKTSVPEQRLLAIRLVNATMGSSPQPSSTLPVPKTEPIMPERN